MTHRSGFTFIELIVYVSLITVVMGGVIQFGWNIFIARSKSYVVRTVTQNIQFSTKRILYEIRNASSIRSVNATSICLSSPVSARNPTKIYLSSGRLRIGWGGGTSDCTNLLNDQPLTSNTVSVTSLLFENMTSGSGSSRNIRYTITINYDAPSSRKEWQRSQSATGTAELRTN